MMTETYGSLEYVMGFYGTPKHPGVHFPFNFMFLEIKRSDNATYIKDRIKSWYDKMPSYGWANWVVSILKRRIVSTLAEILLFVHLNYRI